MSFISRTHMQFQYSSIGHSLQQQTSTQEDLSILRYDVRTNGCWFGGSMTRNGMAEILGKLRTLMQNPKYVPQTLNAYIVPTGDAHQSEYVAACDSRRSFISGFTGSAGTAIVTANKAALWTDGRYYLQAEQQLDENWQLVKEVAEDLVEVKRVDNPTQAKWLSKLLPVGGAVGCDPSLLSHERWMSLERELKSDGFQLIDVRENLVDLIWTDRPERPCNSLLIQALSEAGLSWQDKVKKVQTKMDEKNVCGVVFTALDEVAWLYNLRGSDIIYNPVFFSYAIVTKDCSHLFIDENKLDTSVKNHLGGVDIQPYENVHNFLSNLADKENTTKIWLSDKSSHAICNQVPKTKRLMAQSCVAVMKAVKNGAELKGMEQCQIRDGVAMCEFLMWLEKEIPTGTVTEISAADKVCHLRSQQRDFVSLSFDTISSTGANAAIIHYKPSLESNKVVANDQIYLVDSGAQFRDGTTDTTRTIHLGTPSKHEQECFTRVLKGHINLATAIWPNGVKGHMLDTLARTSLWEIGLDYQHGTGHGVGSFLNVHEGPCGISFRVNLSEVALEENMVLSDEPGYYEDGKFGIRIESLVKVVKANTKHNFANKGYLTFEAITLVPIQTKMIDPFLLTEKEINWLNEYHSKVLELVGEELRKQGKKEVFQWLKKATEAL